VPNPSGKGNERARQGGTQLSSTHIIVRFANVVHPSAMHFAKHECAGIGSPEPCSRGTAMRSQSKKFNGTNLKRSLMSYSESRNHFEKARMNTADAVTIEMLDGLKHLSHALEEDIRALEQHIRNIQESVDIRKVCS
jgi:hypothetical protein